MIYPPYPSEDELRAASMTALLAPLREELDALLRSTRRGRLLVRLSRWRATRGLILRLSRRANRRSNRT